MSFLRLDLFEYLSHTHTHTHIVVSLPNEKDFGISNRIRIVLVLKMQVSQLRFFQKPR